MKRPSSTEAVLPSAARVSVSQEASEIVAAILTGKTTPGPCDSAALATSVASKVIDAVIEKPVDTQIDCWRRAYLWMSGTGVPHQVLATFHMHVSQHLGDIDQYALLEELWREPDFEAFRQKMQR